MVTIFLYSIQQLQYARLHRYELGLENLASDARFEFRITNVADHDVNFRPLPAEASCWQRQNAVLIERNVEIGVEAFRFRYKTLRYIVGNAMDEYDGIRSNVPINFNFDFTLG